LSDLDSFLTAIEADPADDMLWLVFADWLEERGSPISGIIRRAIERKNWYEGFGLISRTLGYRGLQLLACDAVEPLLPVLERDHPRLTAPRRLVEAVRDDPNDGRRLRILQTEVSDSIPYGRVTWEGEYPNPWLAWSVACCLEKFYEKPRESCISSARAMAFQKMDAATLPSRVDPDELNSVIFTFIESHRDPIEIELRRLSARAIGRHFIAKADETADP
jgi:uncharacterized protein (TIGR02996 family)